MNETYIPGQCNIGNVEVNRRIRNGLLGIAVAFICMLVIEIFNWPRASRWLVFPGLFFGISGFIQARYRFCYLYGWFGLFSMTGRKHIHRVGAENAAQDKKKAIRIIVLVVILSLILTLVYLKI